MQAKFFAAEVCLCLGLAETLSVSMFPLLYSLRLSALCPLRQLQSHQPYIIQRVWALKEKYTYIYLIIRLTRLAASVILFHDASFNPAAGILYLDPFAFRPEYSA